MVRYVFSGHAAFEFGSLELHDGPVIRISMVSVFLSFPSVVASEASSGVIHDSHEMKIQDITDNYNGNSQQSTV